MTVPADMTYKEWYGKYVAKDKLDVEDVRRLGYNKDNKISSSINKRYSSKGKPSAILHLGESLNNRQQSVLDKLEGYDSRVIVKKNKINMADLSALTAKTGDEYAMFTKGNTRLIVRGDSKSVNIGSREARKLYEEGYKWSGHTHPGYDYNCLLASRGDKEILVFFEQTQSVIYNSKGQYNIFELG